MKVWHEDSFEGNLEMAFWTVSPELKEVVPPPSPPPTQKRKMMGGETNLGFWLVFSRDLEVAAKNDPATFRH